MVGPPTTRPPRWLRPAAASSVLDHDGDLVRYAHELYGRLRLADAEGDEIVVAVVPPAVGLGHAIGDRLRKAAAGSPEDPGSL